MGIQFGFSFTFGFPGPNQYGVPTQPGSDGLPSPAATPVAQAGADAPVAQAPAALGYLSPAYLMIAPQMGVMAPSMAGAAMGAPAAAALDGDSPTSGHVTQNPTNSLASAGYGGSYGAGATGGAMAMPVGVAAFALAQPVLLAPVFLQFGMPVFAGFAIGPQPVAMAQQPTVQEPAATTAPQPAAEVPDETAPPVAEEVVIDEKPAQPAVELPIKQYSAEEFSRLRMKSLDAELVTSLELSLQTREGDVVTLDFNQVDVLQRSRLSGRSPDGARVRASSFNDTTDRVVNMNVSGDLSDSEKAAIDAVLVKVIEVANKFFDGSVGAALQKLKTMELDTGTLAELSLKMSMTKSVEFTRAYQGGEDQLRRLAQRDGEVNNMLEFFADEQKQLIDMANEVLDGESAVKLVKSLLPPLLEEPLQALAGQVAEHAPEDQPEPTQAAEQAGEVSA